MRRILAAGTAVGGGQLHVDGVHGVHGRLAAEAADVPLSIGGAGVLVVGVGGADGERRSQAVTSSAASAATTKAAVCFMGKTSAKVGVSLRGERGARRHGIESYSRASRRPMERAAPLR
jgi:hypothetical protein